MRTVTEPLPEETVDKMPQSFLGENSRLSPHFSVSRETSGFKQFLGAFVTDHGIDRSVNRGASSVWIHE